MHKRYFSLLLLLCLPLLGFAQIGLPLDFEQPAANYTFEGFEGADSAIEMNPDQAGENTSATVMRSTKTDGAQFFAGTAITLDTPIDFSTNQGISLKTWSPKVNIPIRIRIENADNSIGTEIDIRTKTASSWETLTVDFGSRLTPGAQYTKIIVFFEFVNGLAGDGTTYYFDDIEVADVSGRTPVALPIDFESDDLFYDIAGFEGANANIIANPDASGENTSTSVMEYQKTNGSAFFAGVTVRFDTPIDFSTNKGISISSWSPKANIPVRIQIEGSTPANIRQVDVNTSVANSWETLTADFSDLLVNGEDYTRVVIFYEFIVDLAGDGSLYYVDNVATADAGSGSSVALPVGFEDAEATYRFEGFEGAVSTLETNPDQSGENTSATVMQTIKNEGQWFAGTFLDLDEAIDLSTDKGISISSWSPKADIPVRIQIEDTANSGNNRFVDVNTTVASAWETLTADFTNVAVNGANYDRITVIFEAIEGLAGDGSTYYYDNIATVDVGPGGPGVELPVDFESMDLTYRFEGFEGADSAIETNPDQNGENTSMTVMRTTKNDGQWFAGTFLDLDTPIDFSSDKGISISSWSPKADIPVRIQIEGPDGNVFVDVNTTVASQWETLTADFTNVAAPGATYNRVTVIFEAIEDLAGDGSTYYYDNIATADVGGTAGDPVTIPVGFENPDLNYRFGGFEGADSAIEMNPDQSGLNTSATVMRTTKTNGAQFFAGTSVELDEPIDLSNTGKIVFSSWSPKAGIPIRIQLEDAANTEANRVFVDVNTVNASTWETLEADFSAIQNANADYVRIVIFYEFIVDLPGDGTTYYFDNLSVDELTSTPFLTAEQVQVFPNPTSSVWEVNSPEARIEVLDLFNMNGQRILTATPDVNLFRIDATELPTGTYLLRVQTAEGRRITRLVKQ